MVLVNNIIFPREAVGQYEKEIIKIAKQIKNNKFQTHIIKETGDSGKRDKAKCLVFDDHHDIEEC